MGPGGVAALIVLVPYSNIRVRNRRAVAPHSVGAVSRAREGAQILCVEIDGQVLSEGPDVSQQDGNQGEESYSNGPRELAGNRIGFFAALARS